MGSTISLDLNLPQKFVQRTIECSPTDKAVSMGHILNWTNNVDEVSSPRSAAPSPLLVSQSASGHVVTNEPTMPTLSPQPLPKTTESEFIAVPAVTQSSFVAVSTCQTGNVTRDVVALRSTVECLSTVTVSSALSIASNNDHVRKRSTVNGRSVLKRPTLPLYFDGDNDEELVTSSLYDLQSINSWLVGVLLMIHVCCLINVHGIFQLSVQS